MKKISCAAFAVKAHEDPKGRLILDKMMIDKFVVINDSAYDTVREMKAWLDGEGR